MYETKRVKSPTWDRLFYHKQRKIHNLRLLADDGLFFSGHFLGISRVGDHLPLIDGLLIEDPQFNLHMMYKTPDDGRLLALNINLLLVDDMADIKFE